MIGNKMNSISRLRYLLLAVGLLCLASCRQSAPMDMAHRVEATMHDTGYVAVVAHRGDWRNWPENSLPAIESAIGMGVDMVEIDVKRTRDSVLVLCHDWTIDRTTTGSGAVGDYTYEELMAFDLKRGHGIAIPGLKMPTLREALEVCKGRILVNVDQGFDYYDQVLALCEELGMCDQVLIKSGRPQEEVAAVMNRHTAQLLFMPVVGVSQQTDTALLNGYMTAAPLAFELCFDSLDEGVKEVAARVAKVGAKVWVNTLWGSLCGNHDDDRAFAADDPDAVYGPILALGANIIQTDRPEMLIAYLEEKGRR